jgi:hypothetical protein
LPLGFNLQYPALGGTVYVHNPNTTSIGIPSRPSNVNSRTKEEKEQNTG